MTALAQMNRNGSNSARHPHKKHHQQKHRHHGKSHKKHQSLAQGKDADCDGPLAVTAGSMAQEMDKFSRTFNVEHYDNALIIAQNLGVKPPKVITWELYDKAFSWPSVRKYQQVQKEMHKLEMFQDNLNLNLSNSHARDNFIKAAKEVQHDLKAKYGEAFLDPADEPEVQL